jgi:hypothetical protein
MAFLKDTVHAEVSLRLLETRLQLSSLPQQLFAAVLTISEMRVPAVPLRSKFCRAPPGSLQEFLSQRIMGGSLHYVLERIASSRRLIRSGGQYCFCNSSPFHHLLSHFPSYTLRNEQIYHGWFYAFRPLSPIYVGASSK